MSNLTTVKEIKTALAIGCKIRHSRWGPGAYIYLIGSTLFSERQSPFIPLDSLEQLIPAGIGYWELYHENQGSDSSPKDRV
jgi:hypothetical protein|nr:MAG TPA: ATP-dependent DNA helicase [Caudoviricetes sp.]